MSQILQRPTPLLQSASHPTQPHNLHLSQLRRPTKNPTRPTPLLQSAAPLNNPPAALPNPPSHLPTQPPPAPFLLHQPPSISNNPSSTNTSTNHPPSTSPLLSSPYPTSPAPVPPNLQTAPPPSSSPDPVPPQTALLIHSSISRSSLLQPATPPFRSGHQQPTTSSFTMRKRPSMASSHPTKKTPVKRTKKSMENAAEPLVIDTMGIEFVNTDQRAQFERLHHRTLQATKFVDEDTLNTLGIHDDVKWLFENLFWNIFFSTEADTYRRLTLEFLSSLTIISENINNDGVPKPFVSFRLMNKDFKLSYERLNQIFGWPIGGGIGPDDKLPENYISEEKEFWKNLTGEYTYSPRSAKASHIVNPCFRYAHRVLSCTLFVGADSVGVVSRPELFFLWSMTQKPYTHFCQELSHAAVQIDAAMWLVSKLLKVRDANSGIITCGGLISYIAKSEGIDLDKVSGHNGNDKVSGFTKLHLKAMVRATMIKNSKEPYVWLVNEKPYIHLPNPERVTLNEEANWCFPREIAISMDENDEDNVADEPPQMPPNFMELFTTLEQQIHDNNLMLRAICEWHVSQGHFDDPLMPPPSGSSP